MVNDSYCGRFLLPHQEMMPLFMSSGRIEYLGRLPIVAHRPAKWLTCNSQSDGVSIRRKFHYGLKPQSTDSNDFVSMAKT